MKKLSKLIQICTVSCIIFALFAQSASAATLIDASKQKIPASFITKAKDARTKFKANKLVIPFSPASTITKSTLSKMTIRDLNQLEASFFAMDSKNFFDDFSKKSTSSLSSANKKAVELIRAERNQVKKMLPAVKSGASIDMDGDGKKDTIRFGVDPTDENLQYASVNGKKVTEYGYQITGAYIADIGSKQKALLIEVMTDNDYRDNHIIFYNGKTVTKLKTTLPQFNYMRYAGKGVFYVYENDMPVGSESVYKLTTSSLKRTGASSQLPMYNVMPMKKVDEYEVSYDVKCKTIEGGTVTFKSGERLSVLATSPLVIDTANGWKIVSEAYIAVINQKGTVGLLTTSSGGYYLGGTEKPMMQIFRGFVFMP